MTQVNVVDTQLKGKDLLTLMEPPPSTIQALVEKAIVLKQEKLAGSDHGKPLAGKILGMIFEKSSTRTRVSFEAGMLQLGGQAIVMNSKDLQIGRGEPISDTAKVMSHYIDAIMIRTFSHSIIEELAEHATIPVINGLTDLAHPCQALADMQTVLEEKGKFSGLKMAYIGDGNNVAHSLMVACAKLGMDIAVATPQGYEPDAAITEASLNYAKESGANVVITNDPIAAITDADVVYADVWTSMGQEAENEIRLKAFTGFQVNDELVKHAKPDYIFLHCLPARREEEVSASVIDGPNSRVFEQAGNRLHAQKALLVEILKN